MRLTIYQYTDTQGDKRYSYSEAPAVNNIASPARSWARVEISHSQIVTLAKDTEGYGGDYRLISVTRDGGELVDTAAFEIAHQIEDGKREGYVSPYAKAHWFLEELVEG
jgi:hypothetical protein